MSVMRQVMTMSALLAGSALVGAGLGLLLAPQSGRVTRGQLQVHLHKAQDHMTHIGGRVKHTVGEVVEKGKSVLGNHKQV